MQWFPTFWGVQVEHGPIPIESPSNGQEPISDEALNALFDLSGDDCSPEEDIASDHRVERLTEDLAFLSPTQQARKAAKKL